jgi:hypothetical protein
MLEPGRERGGALLRHLRWPALIFAGYALALLWLVARHEVWRDEVRAYAIAEAATDPIDLIRHQLADEGHPPLWHLLLWLGWSVCHSPVVLKAASYLVAVGFSALVFFRSPFPLLHRTLFLAGIFPLFTYSVVARNYGISVLCLFLLACEYVRPEPRSPWRAGLYNALLANTNVFGALCSIAFLLVPLAPGSGPRRGLRAWAVVAGVTALGLLLAAYTMWPSANNQALDAPDRRPPSGVTDRSLPAVLRGVAAVVLDREGWSGLVLTGQRWKQALEHSVGELGATAVGFAGLVLLCLPLARCRWLLASFAAALLATGLFSRHVHLAADRHLGVLVAFYFTLLWIAWGRAEAPGPAVSRLGLGVAAACLLAHAGAGLAQTARSLRVPFSQSRNAGTFLAGSYPEAVVLCEPDFFAESLHYYTPNPLYFVREDGFGTFVHFMRPFNRDIHLTELMEAACRLSREGDRPVVVSLQAPIAELRARTERDESQRRLLVADDEVAAFAARFREVGRFTGPGAEVFVFYVSREE